MSDAPDLSAIVVAYNSGPGLRRCLDSVRREALAEGITAELVVVDNASRDGCVDGLDGVEVLRNEENRGFGAAANQGFRRARGARILLLNPDARLAEGSLGPLLRELDADPSHALAAPTLRLPDGAIQESPRRFYDLPAVLAQRTPWGDTAAGQRARDHHLMRDADLGAPRTVDWVTGAAMLLDRRAVGADGPFDERFFLYFEDVDLCRRLGASGASVRFVPEAVVEHDHARGSRAHQPWNPLLWQHVLSGVLYAERWSGRAWGSRWWRAGLARLARAASRAGLLAAVGLALGLPLAWTALAAVVALVLLPSRRLPAVGEAPAPSVVSTGIAVAGGSLAALGVATLTSLPAPGLAALATFAGLGAASLIGGSVLARAAVRALRRRGFFYRSCLVAGPADDASALVDALAENPASGLSVLGYVPLDALSLGGPTPRLRDWSHVEQVAADLRADTVLLCGSHDDLARSAEGVVRLREHGVSSAFVLSGTSELLQEEAASTLAGLPVLTLGAGAEARVLRALRGAVDRCVAALAAVAVVPLVAALALVSLVRFRSVFVAAERIGQGGAPFAMWRLRTGPTPEGDTGGGALGALLRRLHLDELPQLLNVVRGEMSLVGPRPVTRDVWDRLEPHERARCLVRPGITGMWQLDRLRRWRLEQMIVSDLLYLLRWSPRLDLRILARTLLGR